jgi:hypothetical protein
MIPERVLQHSPLVLGQRQREQYFEDGFLPVPGYVGAAWLDRLRAVVAAKKEESRALTASDDQFDLAPDHSAEKPNIRRLRKAIDQHPELWAFATDSPVVDLVVDASARVTWSATGGGSARRSLICCERLDLRHHRAARGERRSADVPRLSERRRSVHLAQQRLS